jgi:hypothetical protein
MQYRLGFPLLISNPAGRDIEMHSSGLLLVSAAALGTLSVHCCPDRSVRAEAETDFDRRHQAKCLWLGLAPGLAVYELAGRQRRQTGVEGAEVAHNKHYFWIVFPN